MKLYMVEPTVSDLPRSIVWYSDVLGLTLTLLDDANGFALLEGEAGRISLKLGTQKVSGVRMHFEVADLDAELKRLAALGVVPVSAIKSSGEGYRRAVLHDRTVRMGSGRRVGKASEGDEPGTSQRAFFAPWADVRRPELQSRLSPLARRCASGVETPAYQRAPKGRRRPVAAFGI